MSMTTSKKIMTGEIHQVTRWKNTNNISNLLANEYINELYFIRTSKLSLDSNLNITKTQIISVRKLQQQRELELLSNNLDGREIYGYYD